MEIDYEIAIEPCYQIYARIKSKSLLALHSLFEEYFEKEHNGDRAQQVQAWHYLQAVIQCLRDLQEWDEDYGKPKPYFTEESLGVFHKVNCPTCHITLSWDFPEWRRWNGHCSCCGTILDPELAERAA